MVALSIYFSYAIWLSPAGKSSINVDETNTQMIESQTIEKLPKSFFRFMLHGTIQDMIQETTVKILCTDCN